MYTLHLSDSLISAQEDDIVREVTVGDLLREVCCGARVGHGSSRSRYGRSDRP